MKNTLKIFKERPTIAEGWWPYQSFGKANEARKILKTKYSKQEARIVKTGTRGRGAAYTIFVRDR